MKKFSRRSFLKSSAAMAAAAAVVGVASQASTAEAAVSFTYDGEVPSEDSYPITPEEFGSGDVKYTVEETEDGWIKVTNEGGAILGYHPKSGVQLIQVDGFAFKDLNGDGTLNIYEDWRQPADARAKDLASQMTVDEMAGLRYTDKDPGADADAIKDDMVDAHVRHFLGNALAKSDTEITVSAVNKMQRICEGERLGIPVIPSMDPPSAYMHSMSQLAMAATFDPDAVQALYKDTAKCMRSIGVYEMLGPQSDTSTEPRWSRVNGTFGGDPALVRDLSKAAVTGLQSTFAEDGTDLGWGDDSVIAQVKHFPGDGAAESGRESHNPYGKYNVYPGGQFETALIPFFDGSFKLDSATGSAAAVMPSYSIAWDEDEAYGELVGSNFSEYKINLLRENGFDGVISTDSLIFADNPLNISTISVHGMDNISSQDAIYQIIRISIDRILMPDFGEEVPFTTQIRNTYDMLVDEYGEEEAYNNFYDSAVRMLRAYFRTGAFECPYSESAKALAAIDESDISDGFCEIGQKSIVMLKNKDGVIKERTELPKVYIPMAFTAASESSGGSTPASWSLPVDEAFASQYIQIVTDTIGEPSGTDADGNAAYTEDDVIRASADEIAACDFAAAFVSNPSTSGYENEEYIPVSLQYGEYTADNEFVRTKSLSQGIITEIESTPYGDQTNSHKDERSYYGKSNIASNYSDLVLIQDTVALAGSCPVIVCVTASKPMIFNEFESTVSGILVSFGADSSNFFPILGGQVEPTALLPVQMPANMETVEAQYEDVPRDMECHVDSEGNTYNFTFGMNWSGVIDDDRVAQYNVAPLTTCESIEFHTAD